MSALSTKPVTLDSLGGGVLAEKFAVAWEKVMNNVMDPNANDSQRVIDIKITVKPTEEREVCNIVIKCEPKLAPDFGFSTMIYVDQDIRGNYTAFENNPRQSQLPFKADEGEDEPKAESKVRVIGGKKE